MIYLDNAATTYPKPPSVRRAVEEAFLLYGANPGRGGYPMAMATAAQVYACREAVAEFFGAEDASGVIFTANCTMALNFVIKGLLANGGHAVISSCEHNAVIRPLTALEAHGVTFTEATVHPDDIHSTVESFRRAVRPDTRLILCTHASNVGGWRLPIREIGALAHRLSLPFAVDAAQSAGILPIDMVRDNIDFLCLPGHKALYGPMGTGVLICRGNTPLATVLEGGTGSMSLFPEQPKELPDRLESGTPGVPGICGLLAGVRFVRAHGRETLAIKETACMRRLYDALAGEKGVHLHTERPDLKHTVPLVTLTVEGLPSETVAELLAESGIAVRAGLHCAPSAHRMLGTVDTGAVRFCPSAFTTLDEVDEAAKNLCKIARKPLQSPLNMVK